MFWLMRAVVRGTVLLAIGFAACLAAGIGLTILATMFGILAAFLAIGLLMVKIAVVVILPLLAIGWVVKRAFGVRQPEWHRDLV